MSNYKRLLCESCGWNGDAGNHLEAPHPFMEGVIWGCPECKDAGSIYTACDIEGCPNPPSSGTPTPDGGYTWRCMNHPYEPTSELDKMTTRELCEQLTSIADFADQVDSLSESDTADIREAVRRLSRYAWIPTHDRMPEKADATDKGQILVKWAGGTVSVHQWDAQWRRSFARASMGTAIAWSRINNEPPQ